MGANLIYLDLNNSKLQVKAKITLANGNNLQAGNVVGPVNLMLHSLFSKVDMSLCGKSVSDSNSLYPYRAYLESLLNYNQEVLKTRHYAEGWDKDLSTEIATPAADGANRVANSPGFTRSLRESGVKKFHLRVLWVSQHFSGNENTSPGILPI